MRKRIQTCIILQTFLFLAIIIPPPSKMCPMVLWLWIYVCLKFQQCSGWAACPYITLGLFIAHQCSSKLAYILIFTLNIITTSMVHLHALKQVLNGYFTEFSFKQESVINHVSLTGIPTESIWCHCLECMYVNNSVATLFWKPAGTLWTGATIDMSC